MAKKSTIPAKVQKYLEEAGFKHEILEHKTVYTAIDASQTLKKKISDVAKSLLVKAGQEYYVVVLPADRNLDLDKLKKITGKEQGKEIKAVKIPNEKAMEKALKIKAGALSSFGNIYKIPTLVDKQLEKSKKAIFSAGSVNHSVEMAVKDFIKLENAVLGTFGIKKKVKLVKPKPKSKTAKSQSRPKKKKK